MMAKDDGYQYIFRISETYTPETMPMGRLSEYMSKIATVLGNRDHVHFARLIDRSTGLALKVDEPARPPVAKRLVEARTPGASREIRQALHEVNEMLRADKGRGELISTAANDEEAEVTVIELHGIHSPAPRTIGPIQQLTTIDGKLNRIGGNNRHARILDAEGRAYNGEFAIEMAEKLGSHLYHWMRFFGNGHWERTPIGDWVLKDFHIKSFEPLAREDLEELVTKLRAVEGNEWAKLEDPLRFIRDARREDDGVH